MIKLQCQTYEFQQTLNDERSTELLIEMTLTLLFQISNTLEHVHLLVIELQNPIF